MTDKMTLPFLLGAGAVLLLLLVVIGPALMDWSSLKPQAEAALSQALHRPVRITGALSARLLPRPELRLEGVSLGESSQAGARALRVELNLLPLLAGRRDIRSLTMEGGTVGPAKDLTLTLTADGALTAGGRIGAAVLSVAGTVRDGRLDGRLSLDGGAFHVEGPLSASVDDLSLPDLALSWGTARGRAGLTLSQAGDPAGQPMGTLDAEIGALDGPAGRLENIRINALLDQGVLTLGPASARLADGRLITVEASARQRDDGVMLAPLSLGIGEVRLEGDALLRPTWPLGLVTRLAMPGLEGVFDGSVDETSAQGNLSLAGPSFAKILKMLSGTQPRGGGPLTLGAHLRADAKTLSLDGLRGTLGETAISGQARLDLAGRELVADIASPALPMGAFLPADGKPSPLESWRLEDVAAHILATPSTLTIERLTGRALGGSLAAAGRANAAGWAASVTLRGADAGLLKLGAGPVKLTQGKVNADLRAAARGFSQADLRTGLTGDGKIEAHDGVVTGFDLATVNARLSKLEDLGSLLGLIQAGLSGGQSHFSSLSATIKAERGMVASRDIALVAEGGGGDGTASLDLSHETIDAHLSLHLATPGSPPLGLRLSGPLSAPNTALDVNAMQRYLVERGLGKALNGKGGGLLESLLGGKLRIKSPQKDN